MQIFIDSSKVTFARQMVSFLGSTDSRDNTAVLLLQESQVNTAWLKSRGVTVIPCHSGRLPAALDQLANIINTRAVESVDIHLSLGQSGKLLIPFLQKTGDRLSGMHLHLYEEGVAELTVWQLFDTLSPVMLEKLLFTFGQTLKSALHPQAKIPHEIQTFYGWHHVLKTAYYRQPNNRGRFPENMQVVNITPLTEAKREGYLTLFNLQERLFAQLKAIVESSSTLLFLASPPLFSCTDAVHQTRFADVLATINMSDTARIVLRESKGSNKAEAMLAATGKPVTTIPDCFSLPLLSALGVLPARVAGDFSDELIQTPGSNIAFSLMAFNADEMRKSVEVMKYHQLLSDERIYYLDDLTLFMADRPTARIFYCPASMGDMIYALGCMNAVRSQFTEPFTLVAHGLYTDLANASPVVDRFWNINSLSEEHINEIERAKREGRFHHLGAWEHIVSDDHMTDAFIKEVTGKTLSDNRHAVVDLNTLDGARVEAFIKKYALSTANVVLLHANYGAPNRTWSEQAWEQLADYFLAAGWKVVLIGSDNNKCRSKKAMPVAQTGVIDAVNIFSVLETVYLMQRCQLLVACDSGPVGLAGLTDIAICALYSMIPARYRLPYRHGKAGWNACGINLSCEFGQCGHLIMDEGFFTKTLRKPWSPPTGEEFAAWCPARKSYKCMKRFGASQCWQKIQAFLRHNPNV
ncbi:glycosyltransferase family 9 protein [Pseudescherichia sp.]|uniref:glycosyltransferase family 9 protein n=1 Tax=Pseudescherichia sp. TaxID=2055881 RepID=UPI002898F241|nr:glycosyltransferase family 9 protein [Pseudescherichia sp.]